MSIAAVATPQWAADVQEGSIDERRLIDNGTLGLEASISGQAERYGRGKTSHTIHVWWARRPHGAMRALTFASLMPIGGGEGAAVMRELALAASAEDDVVESAKRLLKEHYPKAPKVLDVFGGGGTIPYEAALLGADVSSLDYNPLSVFVQKSNLEYSQEALALLGTEQLVGLVSKSGKRVLETLRKKTKDLFPLREANDGKGIFAYFWTYKLPCNECGYEFLLMKRPWLSRKAGRLTALSLKTGEKGDGATIIEDADEDAVLGSVWGGRNGTASCPKCQAEQKNPSIQSCSDAMVAVGELLKRGKAFKCSPADAVPSETYLKTREKKLLKSSGLSLPDSRLPRWTGIVNPAIYGIETHADFLNRRQRLVLLELICALREERVSLQAEHTSDAITRYVISALAALVDQLVDWNCRLSMWISQNEQVGRAFCGPGVPMLWDYVETDPVLSGPANLWDKLERILAAVAATPRFETKPKVHQGRAQKLPFKGATFDAVVTDPPYYDNIYYNILADFFYAWKKPVLEDLCPELFNEGQCGEEDELVSSQFRRGKDAHSWYCAQLTQCLQEVTRVLKPDGILSFVFAHSSLAGWDAIVQSFRHSGLVLTSAEPLSIERRQRPRAMTSEAVNTCIVLVGRKATEAAAPISIAAVKEMVTRCAATMGERLKEVGWQEEDMGMAIFAQGVAAIANASAVTGVKSDADALQQLGQLVTKLAPGFKLQVRKSL